MIDFAFRIRWKPRADKDLQRLPQRDQRRIVEAVEHFSRTSEGDVQKLTGISPSEYRLRIGDYRVRFRLDKSARIVTILRVLPRDKAYKVREPEAAFTTEDALEAGIA